MADTISKIKRSYVMGAIRSSGNKTTELALISLLRKNSLHGWRRKSNLYGKPDFVFKRYKIALFVDGCFWHGCRLHCRMPKTKKKYWNKKIQNNRFRDKKVSLLLKGLGWNVIRIWEHSLKNPDYVIAKIREYLN